MLEPKITTAAEVNFRSLDYFISQVKRETVTPSNDSMVQYSVTMSGGLYEGYFMHKVARLEGNNKLDYKKQLLRVVDQRYVTKPRNYIELLEDCTVELVNEYAFPNMAVNIAPRTWMLCNPEDFKILEFQGYSHIVCVAPQKNKIYRIEK